MHPTPDPAKNVGAAVLEAVRPGGDRTAICSGGTEVSCAELCARVERRVADLAPLIGPGAAVGVETRNDVRTFVDFLAIWLTGAAVVPISRDLPDDSVRMLRRKARLVAVIGEHRAVQVLADRSTSSISTQAAVVLYTTGSTGSPKGVVITHKGLLAKLSAIFEQLELANHDRWLVTLRLEFSFAQWVTVLGLLNRKTIVYCEPYEAGAVVSLLGSGSVDAWFAVPSAVGRLMQTDDWRRLEGSKHTATPLLLVFGGEPLAPEIARAVRQAFPGLRFGGIYGLTETSTPEFVLSPSQYDMHPESIGLPLPGVSTRNKPSSEYPELAELWTKSEGLMLGYLDDDESTAAAIVDGFIRTRDLVRDPGDGFLVHMGRVDDVVSVGGFKVAVGEVEAELRRLPGIAAAVVYKSPDHEWLEAVVSMPEQRLTGPAIQRALQARMEHYKRPRRVYAMSDMPTKGLGKSDRREIVRRAALREFESVL